MIMMLGLIFTTIILTACSAFVPPDGSYFKLQNLHSGKCIFNKKSNGIFNVYECGQSWQYYDQYWTLISDTANPGYFQIKNKATNKCIVSNTHNAFGIYDCNHYDQKWQFIESKHYFQIKNQQSKKCIYNHKEEFNHYNCNDNDDQLWQFIMEDSEVQHVKFDINNKDLSLGTPFVIGEKVCHNIDSKEPQTIEIHASKTITETSSFENSVGVGMSASATFSAGIPMLSASATVEMSASKERTWGKEESTERALEIVTSVTCGPGEQLEGKCVAHQGNLIVPYTMTLITKETKKEYEISGVWTGTPAYGVECDVVAITSAPTAASTNEP